MGKYCGDVLIDVLDGVLLVEIQNGRSCRQRHVFQGIELDDETVVSLAAAVDGAGGQADCELQQQAVCERGASWAVNQEEELVLCLNLRVEVLEVGTPIVLRIRVLFLN